MYNSGMGPDHVNVFLSSCNLPTIDNKTIRKKELEIGQAIVKIANESCENARKGYYDIYKFVLHTNSFCCN